MTTVQKDNDQRKATVETAMRHLKAIIDARDTNINYTPFEGALFVTNMPAEEKDVMAVHVVDDSNTPGQKLVRIMSTFDDTSFIIEMAHDRVSMNVDDVIKVNSKHITEDDELFNAMIQGEVVSTSVDVYKMFREMFDFIPTLDFSTRPDAQVEEE